MKIHKRADWNKRVYWIFFENLLIEQARSSTKLGLRNKRPARTNLLNLISEQAENLRVWWKKYLKNLSEQARLFREFRESLFAILSN